MLAAFQVPTRFFAHFYIASVFSSGFWAFQLITKGSAFRIASQGSESTDQARSMSVDQVALTWALMAIQGLRRLLECIYFGKSSASRMWIAHWVLGISFYFAIGIAIWIEGAPVLLSTESVYFNITMSAPSLKTIIGCPIFILASGIQHDCHVYLASLPKYSLPTHPNFQLLVCPHYFSECLIYLSFVIIAAPKGAVCNKTILCAFIFVTFNLAVTASATKEWYAKKFGEKAVLGKWKMVPWLY